MQTYYLGSSGEWFLPCGWIPGTSQAIEATFSLVLAELGSYCANRSKRRSVVALKFKILEWGDKCLHVRFLPAPCGRGPSAFALDVEALTKKPMSPFHKSTHPGDSFWPFSLVCSQLLSQVLVENAPCLLSCTIEAQVCHCKDRTPSLFVSNHKCRPYCRKAYIQAAWTTAYKQQSL